jgi:hypothetical protein
VRWRYLRNVTARHEILCARRGDALVGWLAMRPRDPDVLAIVDVVAADPAAPAALLDAAAAAGHRRGANALWATVLRDSPVEALFRAAGFIAREEAPGLVVYAPRAAPALAAALQDPRQWWMLEGDEDV